MLVLARKIGQKIKIGENITITIIRIGDNSVRVGIEAPRAININRLDKPRKAPDNGNKV